MQFLQVPEDMKLAQLSNIVGSRNIDSVLSENQITRQPNIGQALRDKCSDVVSEFLTPLDDGSIRSVTWQRKQSILNQLSSDADVFEAAALLGSNGWIVLSEMNTFPGRLRMPEDVPAIDSSAILGNSTPVSETIYRNVMNSLASESHSIDASIFNQYYSAQPAGISYTDKSSSGDVFSEFPIPWGDITLYSELTGENRDIPVYPEEVSDSVQANYAQMPDMIYQYEPWQVYTGSGPRSNTYVFTFHRDMWNGGHTIVDGGANELVRFCMANCYPEYRGSAVYTSTVTLYVRGNNLITGVLTDVSAKWSGPLGDDGWYLVCELSLTITEVSKTPLNYEVVRKKSIIG